MLVALGLCCSSTCALRVLSLKKGSIYCHVLSYNIVLNHSKKKNIVKIMCCVMWMFTDFDFIMLLGILKDLCQTPSKLFFFETQYI